MFDFFSNNYDIFRALHIIAVIAWMAGLMYLPRIFVYHSKVEIGSNTDETLKTMERKLFRFIMEPSMIVVWLLGISLIFARGGHSFLLNQWFIIKFICVLSITIVHFFYGKWQTEFYNSKRPLNHVFYRFINELPFLLMIIAVFMVVLEPNL